jgi:hypothetical protein
MAETAIALLLAHCLADFLFQTDAMVEGKRSPKILALHIAIVTAATWLLLGLPPEPWLIALIGGSHLIIDAIKLRWGGPGFGPFFADQSAHLAMIALGATLFPGAWSAGLWASPQVLAVLPWLAAAPEAMLLATGLVATVWAGGYAVAALMSGVGDGLQEPDEDDSLPRGGRMIGRLERLMILIMVLSDQTAAIGLLIAAKSILRFGEATRSRKASEYVIIGTLASVAWALAIAYLTRIALPAS